MTLERGTPAPKHSTTKFVNICHKMWTRKNVVSELFYNLLSRTIPSYYKRITPFRGTPNVHIVVILFTMNYFSHRYPRPWGFQVQVGGHSSRTPSAAQEDGHTYSRTRS